MGIFNRRRERKPRESREGPTIEEVGEDDAAPESKTKPTIEEPDEHGNHYSQRDRSFQPPNAHDPFADFFGQQTFGGFGDPFGGRQHFPDSLAMHSHFFGMRPTSPLGQNLFEDSFFDHTMGLMASPGPMTRSMQARDLLSERSKPQQGTRGGDQFAYHFESWSSIGDGSGERTDRHFSARGSTNDDKHHVSESVRDREGRVKSRQVCVSNDHHPFLNAEKVERIRNWAEKLPWA